MAKKDIQIAIKKVKSLKKNMESIDDIGRGVITQTIKDTAMRAPAQVTKAVTTAYTIKSAEVRNAAKIISDQYGNMSIVYSGRPLTLTHFQMTPKARPEGGKKYKVRATIVRGQKREFPKAFLASAGSAGTVQLPFQRKGDTRYPIEAIKRTSIPQMIEDDKPPVREDIRQKIDELMSGRLDHHVARGQKKIDKLKKSL